MRKEYGYAVICFIGVLIVWLVFHFVMMQWGKIMMEQPPPLEPFFVFEYYTDARFFPLYRVPSLQYALKISFLVAVIGYSIGISTTTNKSWSRQNSCSCRWTTINFLFLAGTGFATLMLTYEYGSQGYYLGLLSIAIPIIVLGLGQSLLANRLAPYSPWEFVSIFSWLLYLFIIIWFLRDEAEQLPNAYQLPGAGIAILFIGFVFIFAALITTLISFGFGTGLLYLNRRYNSLEEKQA